MLRVAIFLLSVTVAWGKPISAFQNTGSSPKSVTEPAWQQRLKARHEALIEKNGPGTDATLRSELLSMGKTDQEARGVVNGVAPKQGPQSAMVSNLAQIDNSLTAKLKQIVSVNGWPTITLVGSDASQAAMLILIHSPDHEWQRSLLPGLESLAKADKIDGSGIALVVDKDLVASGKLQRYGSQFKFMGDKMAMYAVEDPAGLDQRRAEMMLPPMDAYKQMMTDMYHLRVTEQTVSATPDGPPKSPKP